MLYLLSVIIVTFFILLFFLFHAYLSYRGSRASQKRALIGFSISIIALPILASMLYSWLGVLCEVNTEFYESASKNGAPAFACTILKFFLSIGEFQLDVLKEIVNILAKINLNFSVDMDFAIRGFLLWGLASILIGIYGCWYVSWVCDMDDEIYEADKKEQQRIRKYNESLQKKGHVETTFSYNYTTDKIESYSKYVDDTKYKSAGSLGCAYVINIIFSFFIFPALAALMILISILIGCVRSFLWR